jgi:hypothetical protein
MPEPVSPPQLIAYRVNQKRQMQIVPAPRARDWMAETPQAFANRCLPLLIANQAGWVLLNAHRVEATWRGGNHVELQVAEDPLIEPSVVSHFGHGIITWRIPYLFRTPPGFNLLVRGPANWPKDGACAIEGLVETDWCAATFTMNWQLTRVGLPVVFDVDEPFCMIVPQRRGELDAFAPRIERVETDPDLHAEYSCWAASRRGFLTDATARRDEGGDWQKHYMRGTSPSGTRATEHQTTLRLNPFDETPLSHS